MRMGELADSVLLTLGGVTRLISRLEREGLVRREPYPEDRRGAYAILTGAGLDRFSRGSSHPPRRSAQALPRPSKNPPSTSCGEWDIGEWARMCLRRYRRRVIHALLILSLTLTRMQCPAIVGNTGNRKPVARAEYANPCNAHQPQTAHS